MVVLLSLTAFTARAETCRYAGKADHDATLAFTAAVTASRDETVVDVTGDVRARFLFWRVRYLVEERSVWRGAALQELAWNYRYLLDGQPRREQWDVYRRTPEGLAAWRIQGPPETLEQRHPGFGRHWDPAEFGTAWLDDYWRANPTRRDDLDPPTTEPGTPLADLFHWSGVAMPARAEVLLPGFKRNKVAEVTVTPGAFPHAAVSHPLLSDPAGIDARIQGGHLVEASFHGAAALGSVRGAVALTGCSP